MSVALVIVSHSRKLAEGVCELAGQMAPEVRLVPVGGVGGGGLGTSAPDIVTALEEVLGESGTSALLLLDLGSAAMNTELALEMLSVPQRERVAVAQAPLVEGAMVAAVRVAGGGTLTEAKAEAEGVARIEKL